MRRGVFGQDTGPRPSRDLLQVAGVAVADVLQCRAGAGGDEDFLSRLEKLLEPRPRIRENGHRAGGRFKQAHAR